MFEKIMVQVRVWLFCSVLGCYAVYRYTKNLELTLLLFLLSLVVLVIQIINIIRNNNNEEGRKE